MEEIKDLKSPVPSTEPEPEVNEREKHKQEGRLLQESLWRDLKEYASHNFNVEYTAQLRRIRGAFEIEGKSLEEIAIMVATKTNQTTLITDDNLRAAITRIKAKQAELKSSPKK